MNQITVTVDLTARNLEILKQLTTPDTIGISVPAINTAPAPITTPVDEKPAEAKAVTALDVKAVCLQMSKAGRQTELKTAFAKFGGKKLSDIAEADYPALMKELGHA